ncbi:MAG: hypothetical protein QW544_01505 [Candidatus Caldarchaeum sp.]
MSSIWLESFTTLFKRHPIKTPTGEVYQVGGTPSFGKPWIGAAVLIIVLVLLSVFTASLASYFVYVGVSLVPMIALLAYVVRSDRYEPEPKALVFSMVGVGVVLSAFSNAVSFPGGFSGYMLKMLLIEFVFFMVLYLMDANRFTGREFNDHLDGSVYGLSLGAGYIAYQNFYLLSSVEIIRPELVLSAAVEGFVLGVFPALSGWWIGYVKAKYVSVRFSDLFAGFVPVAVLKMISVLVLAGLALLGVFLRLVGVVLLALLLVAIIVRRVSWALQDEVAWGYAAGRAPVEKKVS